MISAIPTLSIPTQVVKASPHALCVSYGGGDGLQFDQYLWVIGIFDGDWETQHERVLAKTVLIAGVVSFKMAAQVV